MEKRIEVPTTGTIPCTFHGVGVSIMSHFHDEMTVKTHGGLAVHIVWTGRLSHVFISPYGDSVLEQFLFLEFVSSSC
jgi:hypothetical protein